MEILLTCIMIALVVMGAMSLALRVNMVVKKPEHYRQFREMENGVPGRCTELDRRQAGMVSRAAWGGMLDCQADGEEVNALISAIK